MALTQHSDVERYIVDASNLSGGYADCLYMPETEEEVGEILKECSQKKIPITIAGAGTGLAGGRIPFGGAVLSLAKMNKIIEIDEKQEHVVVEAGVILHDLHTEVESRGLLYPPDPTERGGQLGGNFATNASGARTFKYGSTRRWVAGAHLFLASGEMISLPRNSKQANGYSLNLQAKKTYEIRIPRYTMPFTSKHSAGYYAKPGMDPLDLFIGSEGTLGVVTRLGLKLIRMPEKLFSGIVFFESSKKMLDFVDEARDRSLKNRRRKMISLDARALEFIDYNSLQLIKERYSSIPENASGGAIWFEQEIDEASEDILISQWAEVIERHTNLSNDSWFALSQKDQERMRRFRHTVPSSAYELITAHNIRKFGTDMGVPDHRFREMYQFYQEELERSGLRNLTWGHIGNSHLHVNMLPESEAQIVQAQQIYDRFVSKALDLGGTVSAEHGIGKLKTKYLHQMYGDEGIEEMRSVKRTLDPNGMLGRGTMFNNEKL